MKRVYNQGMKRIAQKAGFPLMPGVRHAMKQIIFYIFNVALLAGLPLSLWAFFMWAKTGFRLESEFSSKNIDANFFFIFTIIGFVAFLYGYFSLKFRKCWNKKEKDKNPA